MLTISDGIGAPLHRRSTLSARSSLFNPSPPRTLEDLNLYICKLESRRARLVTRGASPQLTAGIEVGASPVDSLPGRRGQGEDIDGGGEAEVGCQKCHKDTRHAQVPSPPSIFLPPPSPLLPPTPPPIYSLLPSLSSPFLSLPCQLLRTCRSLVMADCSMKYVWLIYRLFV